MPESLGGRKRTSMALCRQCNSTTGHEWDAVLEAQLRPVSLLVFPPEHPCGQRQRRVADPEGNRLLLKAGIRGGAEDPQIRIHRESERIEFQISAPTKKRAIQEIRRLIKEGQLPAEREEEFINSIEREEATTRVEFSEGGSVGGPEAWNSVLKSMVTAGLLGGLTWQDMLTAVLLLRGSGPGGPCLMFRDSAVRPLGDGTLPVWRHCVHVETDMEARMVWGYVEYFGTWCAIARLGKCYLGQPTHWTYCVDPVTAEDLTDTVRVDLSSSKALIRETVLAPARARDIAREQVPDPQPLVDACLRAHGVDGSIAITSLSHGDEPPEEEVIIREMKWLDPD